ncbi:hypothetical protein GCM10009665_18550 [Kitasatospora nipponensis]|uniref:Uncharacterized protein n=1 Tax=Kitasatospora nipponensis TaxID=258049 RepID=A0ABN1W1N6_9ACTN
MAHTVADPPELPARVARLAVKRSNSGTGGPLPERNLGRGLSLRAILATPYLLTATPARPPPPRRPPTTRQTRIRAPQRGPFKD